jgi:carboxypeptidase PM20D1
MRWNTGRVRCFVATFATFATWAIYVGVASGADADEKRGSQEIAERLAGAIRFETVSHEDSADFDAEPFRQLASYLRDIYPLAHETLDLERVNIHTLLFRWEGSDPSLQPALFMSHTDVVPVEEAAIEAWTHPPYSGLIEDGYVWGRGAIDVKSGVILWLEAIESLLAEGFEPERSIYLSLGHDEEIGGFDGAAEVARLFREREIRPAFLFDEGGFIFDGYPLLPDVTTALVVIAEKAYFTVELTTHGVSGHSSMPPRSTAIGKLARAIYRVEENPMPSRLIQPVREMFEVASPHLSIGQRFAVANLWLMGGAVKRSLLRERTSAPLVRTTFATTLISGGVKDNVIPELAQATINVRILPGDTPEDVIAHLTRVIDDPEVEIKGTSWGKGAAPASASGPAFSLAKAAISDVLPDAVVLPGLIPGATDSRHFAGQVDEIVRFVPERLSMEQASGAHGRDERLAVEHLADSVAIAVGMVRRAGTPTEK